MTPEERALVDSFEKPTWPAVVATTHPEKFLSWTFRATLQLDSEGAAVWSVTATLDKTGHTVAIPRPNRNLGAAINFLAAGLAEIVLIESSATDACRRRDE